MSFSIALPRLLVAPTYQSREVIVDRLHVASLLSRKKSPEWAFLHQNIQHLSKSYGLLFID